MGGGEVQDFLSGKTLTLGQETPCQVCFFKQKNRKILKFG